MANKGKTIQNKFTCETFTFIETAKDTEGERLVFDFSVAPGGKLPVVHLHPAQLETFEIRKGEFHIKIGTEVKKLTAGERFTIPKGVAHQWWNPSATETAEMNVTFEPALNTETFFEQWCGLCNDGKIKPDGHPHFLQVMAMVNTYQLYVDGPPVAVQKIMGLVAGGVARLMGYKSYYPEYST